MASDQPLPAVLFAAILAHAIDLEGVSCGLVIVLAPDLLFQVIDFGREKLHGTAAFSTHHVVMAAAVVLMFVAGNSVVEGDLAGQSAFCQQFERPVHGRKPDPRVFSLHQAEKFIGRKMLPRFQEGSQDGVPLLGVLQADALQVPMQNLLRLANHLARDAGLVVNALLQAGWHGSPGGNPPPVSA